MFAFCYLPISEKYKSLINVRQNYFDLIILKYLIILRIRNWIQISKKVVPL